MILRWHHLICLLGFRWLGYSGNTWLICPKSSAKLRSSPETLIEIDGKPDDIYAHCPSLKERVMRNRDCAVMEQLNVVAGDEIS